VTKVAHCRFFNVKAVVERLQNQPTWVGLSRAEIDAASAVEARKFLPSLPVAARTGGTPAAAAASRMSRTTDDLPDPQPSKPRASPAQSVGPPSSKPPGPAAAVPSKEAVAAAPRSVNPAAPASSDDDDAAARAAPPPATAAPAPQKAVARSRGQSTSSSLDKSLTAASERGQNYRANPATVRTQIQRVFCSP